MRVTVHVHPGSKAPGVGGQHGEYLIVRVRQRAVDGAATAAVSRALAESFEVRPSALTLVRGATSRTKTFDIEGSDDALAATLQRLLEG